MDRGVAVTPSLIGMALWLAGQVGRLELAARGCELLAGLRWLRYRAPSEGAEVRRWAVAERVHWRRGFDAAELRVLATDTLRALA